jgi:hypothetical protein
MIPSQQGLAAAELEAVAVASAVVRAVRRKLALASVANRTTTRTKITLNMT